MPRHASRTLYGYWRSSAAYRVRIALALKGLEYARRVETNLAPFPTLLEIERRLLALPAFQKAQPEAQPDAPAR
jgi:glutathione S-transferase